MIYSVLYVLLTALSTLLLQYNSGHLVPTPLLLVVGSICAIVFYNFINFKNLKTIYQKFWHLKIHFIFINFIIAILWSCAVYGPPWIGASLYVFLYFSILGLFGQIDILLKEKQVSFLKKIMLICIVGLISLSLYISCILHYNLHTVLGILLTILAGISGYAYSKHSAMLMRDYHVKPTEIIAIRFYFSLILGLLLLPQHIAAYLSFKNISFCFLAGILTFILPLYFSQYAIKKIGPELSAIISSTTPFVTSLLENTFLKPTHQSFFIIYFVYAVCTLISMLNKIRDKIAHYKSVIFQ